MTTPRVLAVMGALLAFGSATEAQLSVPVKRIPTAQAAAPRLTFEPVPVGEKAPDFVTYDVDGKKVSLSDLRGKVVILDFWATWCGPCQVSMPGLEKIYQQIKTKDVVVLSVNTWDEKTAFKDWVQKNSGSTYHFNFVRDPAEGDHDGIRKASIAKRLYKVIGIPTMYVIDREGKVAGSLIGSGNEEGLVKILAKLDLKANAPKDAAPATAAIPPGSPRRR